ncbi:MAG: carboxy terminal-processing peptidase [Cyclobacteriaceae bacterium]|nr:carboxy terminal-processing peptidase [Cyclobacteriaceae bacterium]
MKRFVLWMLFGLTALQAFSINPTDTTLVEKPVYGEQAKWITQALAGYHYQKLQMNDSLSSAIFDSYLKVLDANRSFFLASDIASFEKYRYEIDDLTAVKNVSPAFAMYRVYRKRFQERMKFVTEKLIGQEFDFTKDEYYDFDRETAPWPKTQQELNELWTKSIKNQALSLKLSGKKSEDITKIIRERFERYIKFEGQKDSDDVFEGYMNTIAEAYDPHTNYFSPRAAELFAQDMNQSLEGIGARLQPDGDYTRVHEVLPGGPAEKSDLIHANDRIIGVGQGATGEIVDVVGWRLDDVVKLIKGPKGTQVRLQVLPAETGVNGAPVIISLIRDKVKLEDTKPKKQIVETTQNGKKMKLGTIIIPTFSMSFEEYQKGDPNYNSTTRDVKKLLLELEAEGVDGIVLDLRNNGGGSLMEAVSLTGLFIKNGPVVQVKSSTSRTAEVLTDDDPAIVYNGPLVVLTNRFSASASEIFAGAIQDYHRGVIVGESTYGKGTVQQVVPLDKYIHDEGAGSLKITVQKFYRATGSSTQHKGVTPDVKLPSALDPEQFGESSNPNALPWDEIRSALYQRTPMVDDRTLQGLNKAYKERLKSDPYLNDFVNETNETRRNIEQKRISLNEAVRKKEMEQAEQRKAANHKMDTKLDGEGRAVSTPLPLDDEYLREGLMVLADLITTKVG